MESVCWLEDIYNLLWACSTGKEGECPVRIPNTILQKYQRLCAGYIHSTSQIDGKQSIDKEIRKSFFEPEKIIEDFKKCNPNAEHEIIGYVIRRQKMTDPPSNSFVIEYFDEPGMLDFLKNRSRENNAVIQAFVEPKSISGEVHSQTFRVEWTPRRMNVFSSTNSNVLTNRTVDIRLRAATFDAPLHVSATNELRSYRLRKRLKFAVDCVLQLVQSKLKRETIFYAEMFFKVSATNKLYFLWCNDIISLDASIDTDSLLMKAAGRTLMEVSTAPEIVHYSGKLIPALFECPCCLKNTPKNRMCHVQYRDIIDHFSLDRKQDLNTSSTRWEDDDEACSHRYSDRMREIDGMAAYTKVVYVDGHGEMIPKVAFQDKNFMTSDAAKYPSMQVILPKSNALVFKFLQRLKISKSNRVCQFKNIEDLDESDQQEFLWFKKVWVSKTFQGKFMDAHGMEVTAINMLDISMNLCDECCVTIDVSIVTKLDRSKGELVPHFQSSKAPVLSQKKSLLFSRLGLGLSGQPRQHELQAADSPVVSSKSVVVQELGTRAADGLALRDLNSPGNQSPILASRATLSVGSPVRDRMTRLPVHPSLLLRKLGSPVQRSSPKERGGSSSPNLANRHQEGRQEREQLWSREPVLMPSLIDQIKRVNILKGEPSSLLGLIVNPLHQYYVLNIRLHRQDHPDSYDNNSNSQGEKAGFVYDSASLSIQVSSKSRRHWQPLVGGKGSNSCVLD